MSQLNELGMIRGYSSALHRIRNSRCLAGLWLRFSFQPSRATQFGSNDLV